MTLHSTKAQTTYISYTTKLAPTKRRKKEKIMEKTDTLLSLAENNIDYDSMVKQFAEKIKTGLKFYSQEEFIEKEIERIEKIFIQPIQVKIGGDFRMSAEMNYSEYVKLAYEWLSMGQNWEIENILKSAKSRYLSKYPNGSYNEEQFKTAIIGNLRKGVAFIKYQKFLKEKLQENSRSKKTNAAKRKRIPVPRKSIALLQKEINSICPFCNSQDVDHFEIHHIDENRSNNDLNNLIMLCPTCHSKITKGDILQEVVINKKRTLNEK